MKASFYSIMAKRVKNILGIKDFSLFRKEMHKKIGKIIYHQKYNADDLIKVMCSMGMKEGSIICIHSSMKEFYNFQGTAVEIIDKVLQVIGPDGTLVMPAFPKKEQSEQDNYIFNLAADPTGAGYLAEVFRKYSGVLRSANVQHSVCAIGKHAEYLIKDHTKDHDCWGKKSPSYRMCELKAIVFNLGMPRNYIGTIHHCVESSLYTEHPYWAQFFTISKTFRYYNSDGSISEYSEYMGNLDRRTRESNLFKKFAKEDWQIKKISNLEIKAFYTRSCMRKMIELGRKGISVYYVPSAKKYSF